MKDKQFKCRLCGQSFNSSEERDEHNGQAHPKAYRLSHLFSGTKKDNKLKEEGLGEKARA